MENDDSNQSFTLANHGYAVNGKIMFCLVVILFVSVILILCFHTYANWMFRRRIARRRRIRVQRHLISIPADANIAPASRGLDLSVRSLIPVFVYPSRKPRSPSMECAVCLSDFEENEEGRILPKCGHAFHVECIDMWFVSHSNCPICRAPVTVPINPVSSPEIRISIAATSEESSEGTEPDRSSGEDMEMGCSLYRSSSSCCLSVARVERKPMELAGILVELPRGFDDGGLSSTAGHRVMSLKRVWSI